MTSVLANYKGEWFLAAFAPHLRGCNLSTPVEPHADRHKFQLWQERFFVWREAPVEEITFYPDVRYRGFPVYIWGWKPQTHELRLRCQIGQWSIHEKVGDFKAVHEIVETLRADGWVWNEGDAALFKFCHVDELEKLEGPPPTSEPHSSSTEQTGS